MKHDAIAVIDFGGQYAHLIATKVRRSNVLARIVEPDAPLSTLHGFRGLIISGSPSLSSMEENGDYSRRLMELDIPILGLCFGHQEIAKYYGGSVVQFGREWGSSSLHITTTHPLFEGVGKEEQVWMSHFDSVTSLGPDFIEIGYSVSNTSGEKHHFAAIASDRHKRYGFQFHPEVDGTPMGTKMLENFVLDICGCRPTWSTEKKMEEIVEKMRAQAGNKSVFLLVSGGVDSTVAARVLASALGPDRIQLLHIDNGLMRKNESRNVVEMFRHMNLGLNFNFVEAGLDFVSALEGVIEPEEKRLRIGGTFIEVFKKASGHLDPGSLLLGQGTIYPDTIESGSTRFSNKIKTHHNRVPVVQELVEKGAVIEPLSDLYKEEVRELGLSLGLAREVLFCHPFPGPGFGVRILCASGTEHFPDAPRIQTDIDNFSLPEGIKAAILPIRSVGVKADQRSYEMPVLLSGELTWSMSREVSDRLLEQINGINRCVWNISPGIPGRSRCVPATVTMERLALLREIDHIVIETLRQNQLYDRIWQCPVVLVPVEIDGRGSDYVIIRPVHSSRGMTASPAEIPFNLLASIEKKISAFGNISGVGIDVTSKPPGTIEWE